jgi:hypothetical protein
MGGDTDEIDLRQVLAGLTGVPVLRDAQQMQVLVALLVGRSSAPRPEGAIEGTHRRDRRDQTPQPASLPQPAGVVAAGLEATSNLVHRFLETDHMRRIPFS